VHTIAVVLDKPGHLALRRIALADPAPDEVVVDIEASGISTGTERLLWQGRMPDFPGMGYPLVPGYEAVGTITACGSAVTDSAVGQRVFVPGARCYGEIRGLFGGAASRVVLPSKRALPLDARWGDEAVLLALAATAHHAIAAPGARLPEVIVGHGVLGRLLARIVIALGAEPPVVWESNRARHQGAAAYRVVDADEDERRGVHCICDASGDASVLDRLIERLAPGGEVVLAGFYSTPLTFAFPPAFMREARLRVAAQWQVHDLVTVRDLVASGRLSLTGLITHTAAAAHAESAYRRAFDDPDCLKMTLDWRNHA